MAEQLAFLAGVSERDRILASLRDNHPAYLELLRAYGREHAAVHGTVTIDDVRTKALQRDLPMPEDLGIDSRLLGVVLRHPDFTAVGHQLSTRPERVARSGRNASFITIYKLRRVSPNG